MMVRSMFIILTLIFIVGCGEKQIEVTPKVEEVKNSTTNSTVNEEVKSVTTEEFVPAHIANSTIEVVPH
jgi:predicted small lipoprotein YifL